MELPSQIIQWDRFQTIKEECVLIHIWEDFMQEEHMLDQISHLCGVDSTQKMGPNHNEIPLVGKRQREC